MEKSKTNIWTFLITGLLISGQFLYAQETQKTSVSFDNIVGNCKKGNGFRTFIENKMSSKDIPGLTIAIINDGTITFSGAFGVKKIGGPEAMGIQTLLETASLSKPVFSYFTMRQVEKGILDLDKPLFEYLPNPDIEHDERYRKITARMVLCHSSGFPNWRKGNLELIFAPGTSYGYSGEGYQYLKEVLCHLLHVGDTGLNDMFKREIAGPLSIRNMDYTWRPEMKGNKAHGHRRNAATNNDYQRDPDLFGAAFSLHSSAVGYAKFIIGIMDSKILDHVNSKLILSPQIDIPHAEDMFERGLAFPIYKEKDGRIYYQHTGNNGDFQSLVRFYDDRSFGIVVLCNSDNLFSSGFIEDLLGYMRS